CPKENWKKCVKCQQRMTAEHLTDEHQLQSYFIQRIEKYLNNKGRTLIGWDEILEGGLAPNAIVMSWRGEDGGVIAAQQKHEVIMTPGNPVYFDHTQSENEDSVTIGGFNPLEKVYAYEPIPAKLTEYESRFVLGAQANMWTEYMTNPSKVEYMLFPRMAALSEVLWSKKENKNWEAFQQKLPAQFQRYDLWKANYSKAYFELKSVVEPSEQTGKLKWTLSNKFDMSQTTLYEIIKRNTHDTIAIYDPKDLKITGYRVVNDTVVRKPATPVFINPASFTIDHPGIYEIENYKLHIPFGLESIRDRSYPVITIKQSFQFNKATGKKITLTNPASGKYPGDGAFTLVNGVQNEKGFAKSKEFLGFNGTDCEALIDLGKEETINSVKVHVLDRKSSWIWPPSQMKVYYSADGINFLEAPNAEGRDVAAGELINDIELGFSPAFKTRYIKVLLKNYGPIPPGNPGAGNKAWLFVDEIEVK
ncbi:MAG: family 20 glycosylhydrolase, partial [Chitinophagaceae bacterium]